jgi:hypothetical protein
MEASYLTAIRAVELLFPPVNPMVAVFPLASRGYGACICVSFFFFFSC